jgi:hypothetical protein
MTGIIKSWLFNDRRSLILFAAIAIVIIITAAVSVSNREARKKNEGMKAQLAELESLSTEVRVIKDIVISKEKKIEPLKGSGVVSRLEALLKNMGLEAKTIKPMQAKRKDEFLEEDAELEIEKIDLNGIVNLMYQLNNSPSPMKIKSASLKATFEDPDKFILKLTASLISRE